MSELIYYTDNDKKEEKIVPFYICLEITLWKYYKKYNVNINT